MKTFQLEKFCSLKIYGFTKKKTAGDLAFAEALSKNGDIYINDAFGTAHRAHASTAIIAQFFEEKTFGFLIERELASVQRVLDQVARPYTAIVGGAKVSSKIDIVRNLLQKVDRIVIGGGMAFTFIKAQGGSIGTSLVEDEQLETALTILREAKEKGVQIILPTDSKIADAFDNNANTQICKINEIPEGWMGLDIGPESMECMRESLLSSNTILWNGPMGVFEMSNFSEGTERVGRAVAEATEAGAFSLVGGGDSVAAVNQFGLSEHVSYVSTAGGALLEFLEGKKTSGNCCDSTLISRSIFLRKLRFEAPLHRRCLSPALNIHSPASPIFSNRTESSRFACEMSSMSLLNLMKTAMSMDRIRKTLSTPKVNPANLLMNERATMSTSFSSTFPRR